MEQLDFRTRNYNLISPSSKSLLLIKGLTEIPYARQTAELMIFPEIYKPDFNDKNFNFWLRVIHFEKRYWSIDQLSNKKYLLSYFKMTHPPATLR